MVPDNDDAYMQYERHKERDSCFTDQIASLQDALDEIKFICDDYDSEDNADLCNRLEKISDITRKFNF